ncbi:MAG: ATP-binding protein, partial [Cyclobacteriaceae bacterium]|nr:ATP-binding protein [Cyclobacteriaceae bacterium]
SKIWINWIVSVVRNNKGEIAYITGIAHDISEQKKAESAMEHALFELEVYNEKLKQTQSQLIINEKLASLGGLMAGIAHEINNPMNFIKGGVEALKEIVKDLAEEFKLQVEQTDLAEKEKSRTIQQVNMFNRLVGNIDNGVNRTLDIIKGLQVFTRSREDEIVKVDIHQNIDATLIVLNNIYKTIAVVEKHYGDIPLLECNPGKLNQVFSNLITNSSHAIQDKLAETNFSGKIVIRTKLTPDKNSIAISISDNGIGINNEIKKNIFEPFFTTKPVGKGTGLGLSLSYSIIQEHNGTMSCESMQKTNSTDDDMWTTFNIVLPLRQNKGHSH